MSETGTPVNPGEQLNAISVILDKIGARHWPIYKLAFGDYGSATQVDASNPLPVEASPDSYNVIQHDSTADPDGPFIGMRFDAAGTVSLVSGNGDVHALNVLAGEYWPGTVLRVNSTGTALSNAQMVGFKRT